MKPILLTLTACMSLSACASTQARAQPPSQHIVGHWRLNPNKCPDLIEDRRQRRAMRRDEAYDRGRRDVIEDWIERKEARRDEAVTRCPPSAWEWHGPRYKVKYHAPRPVSVNIYYHPKKHVYYRHKGNRRIVIRF